MESVPKIVVKRLQSVAVDSHPDADQLTAFAEHSLAGPERDHVVEHLARCGDCREVVSLALPPQLESQRLEHGGGDWLGWSLLRGSTLRWAAVAAGVVLIASIGTLQYRHHQPSELASNVPRAQPAVAAPAPDTETQSPKPSAQVGGPQAQPRPSAIQQARIQQAPIKKETVPTSPAQSSLAENNPSGSVANQNPTAAPAPQTLAAAEPPVTVEVQSGTVEVAAQSTAQSQVQDQLIQNKEAEQTPAYAERVEKAKPASPEGSLAMPRAARWTLSASGSLQRSFDGGRSWLDVNVKADDSMPGRSAKTQMATLEAQSTMTSPAQSQPQADARKQANFEKKNRSNEKQPVPAASVIFRALSVSSNGAEVWAGGSAGALYHTLDAGNSWARVLPSAAGLVLTGDILSIQFSDPRHGTITTSTPEVWITPDDGQTWQKQP
jgi:Photosynthesis system II assembly factor YCF48